MAQISNTCEKEGVEVGQVMGYRPLTITAPLYRAWATMRLADLKEWIESWALPEMYAGVPGSGAVDAWHEVLTIVEILKLDGTKYCGGVADIAICFNQIRRPMVYQVAKAAGAGMPHRCSQHTKHTWKSLKYIIALRVEWAPRISGGAEYHKGAPSR